MVGRGIPKGHVRPVGDAGTRVVATHDAGAVITHSVQAVDGGAIAPQHFAHHTGLDAIEGAQVGGRLVDRELQVRPSIRLQAGAPVRVLITRDLILEPYQP